MIFRQTFAWEDASNHASIERWNGLRAPDLSWPFHVRYRVLGAQALRRRTRSGHFLGRRGVAKNIGGKKIASSAAVTVSARNSERRPAVSSIPSARSSVAAAVSVSTPVRDYGRAVLHTTAPHLFDVAIGSTIHWTFRADFIHSRSAQKAYPACGLRSPLARAAGSENCKILYFSRHSGVTALQEWLQTSHYFPDDHSGHFVRIKEIEW